MISALAGIGGAAYLLAGLLQEKVTVQRPPVSQPPVEQTVESVDPGKTGPGWHCTWCWAPLEKGSRYCNKCGRRIG